jgi:hypothetical protein
MNRTANNNMDSRCGRGGGCVCTGSETNKQQVPSTQNQKTKEKET